MEPLSLAVFTSRLDTHLLGGFQESCLARLCIRGPFSLTFLPSCSQCRTIRLGQTVPSRRWRCSANALGGGAALRGNLCKSIICTLCRRQGGSQYQAHPQWELPSHLPLLPQNATALITGDIGKKNLPGAVWILVICSPTGFSFSFFRDILGTHVPQAGRCL